jgi:uncharacterized membrane protein
MEKSTAYATLLLVIVIIAGSAYWLLKGYVASSTLQSSLLENYKWLGTVLTVILIVAVGYILNRMQKKE